MADWVAPDTPAAAPPPLPAAPPRAAAPNRDAPPALPVPLRPLTVGDLLDGGLRAWKLAPATMVGLAATFVLPVQLALGVASRHSVDDIEIGDTFGDALTATGPGDIETGFDVLTFLVAASAQGLGLAFVTGAVAQLVSGWYLGHRPTYSDAATGALRRAWPLAVGWVLVHLVEAAFAVLLVVPALVPMAWYAVVSPVVACEAVGPWRALGRSYALCRRRFGAVLLTCLLVALTDAVLSGSLGTLGTLYLEWDLPAGWVVNTAVAGAGLLLTVPFVAAVSTLLYLDLRVRTEGLDIQLALDQRR